LQASQELEEDGHQIKAQVKRKMRMQAKAPQLMKKSQCTPTFTSK